MKQTKFEKLNNIGKPSDDWQNYLDYGFDDNDIEALLDIVKQDSLFSLLSHGDEIWASIHAWRALGQLGNKKAIKPLIELLNQFSLSDDDWSTHELPQVFALFGKQAIKPLKLFLSIKTNEEYARVIASDALAEIQRLNNSLRPDIIRAYQHYIQSPDDRTYDLNGLIIANIMGLKANELFEPIKQMFADNIVDDSICGNLKEVKTILIEDGSHTMIETNIHTKKEFSFEQSYLIINKYFEKYSTNESLQDISQLDGYLAAIICSDKLIIPSIWSVDIWGGKKHLPQWQNDSEFEEFNNCIFEYYNQLCNQFIQNNYQPLIIEDENGKTYPSFWALGFIEASQDWQTDIEKFPIPIMFNYGMIAILADENPEKKLKELNIDFHTIEKNLAEYVMNIYHELQNKTKIKRLKNKHDDLEDDFEMPQNHHADKPFIREGKKIGRNELCPCGSGKKYKKCCINK